MDVCPIPVLLEPSVQAFQMGLGNAENAQQVTLAMVLTVKTLMR